MNGCRKGEINTSPPDAGSQAKLMAFLLCFLTSPYSLFYKRNWHPDADKMVFLGTVICHLLGLPAFPNKVAIPCLSTSSPDILACHAASRASLDSVTGTLDFFFFFQNRRVTYEMDLNGRLFSWWCKEID